MIPSVKRSVRVMLSAISFKKIRIFLAPSQVDRLFEDGIFKFPADIFPGNDIDFDADECRKVIFKGDKFEEADSIGKFHEHVNITAAMGVAPHVRAKEPDPFNPVPVAEDLLVGAENFFDGCNLVLVGFS